MAEDFPNIKSGPVHHDSIRLEGTCNGAIPQWSPVIVVAPGTGETLPRVGTTTTLGDPLHIGIKDEPDKTLVAGNKCMVVVHGVTKCKFLAAAARGTLFQTSGTAGKATVLAIAVIGDVVKKMGKVLSSIVAADNDIGLVNVGAN